jgi:hypothetical protein
MMAKTAAKNQKAAAAYQPQPIDLLDINASRRFTAVVHYSDRISKLVESGTKRAALYRSRVTQYIIALLLERRPAEEVICLCDCFIERQRHALNRTTAYENNEANYSDTIKYLSKILATEFESRVIELKVGEFLDAPAGKRSAAEAKKPKRMKYSRQLAIGYEPPREALRLPVSRGREAGEEYDWLWDGKERGACGANGQLLF